MGSPEHLHDMDTTNGTKQENHDLDYANDHENGTEKSNGTASTSSSAKQWKWPSYITAEWFQRSSNFFVGYDRTLLFKAMLSIRVMIGMGVFIALIIPYKYSLALASVLLLPSAIRTLLYASGIMREKRREDIHPLITKPYTASIEGDFCVFLVGAKLNARFPSSDFKWLGEAFESMVTELESDPERFGYLGGDYFMSHNPYTNGQMLVSYWRSQEHVNAWAKDRMNKHFAPMIKSSKHIRDSSEYGFYHESFKVHAGEYDCVYLNMPRTLFGKVGEIHEAKGKLRTAAGRANLSTATAKQDDGAEVYQIIDSIPKKTAD